MQNPAAHAVHDAADVKVAPPPEKVPAGHCVPTVDPAGQYDPAGHAAATGGDPGHT
jgi:hypothetical protein